MAATKIDNFKGAAPKVSPELMAENVAQTATNVKLSSGDLIPYRTPLDIQTLRRFGEIKAIYPLQNPTDSTDLKWLSWLNDVDVAVATTLNDDEQRIYYTGDGVPKVTNYELAVSGLGPYPVSSYDLGLPLPTVDPVATAVTFSTVSTASVARDAQGVATIVTGSAHNLSSGDFVNISGFSSAAVTYTRSGYTVTVTWTGHGLSTGAYVNITYTDASNITDGTYEITVTGADTFTVQDPTTGTISGTRNATIDMRSYNVTSGQVVVVDSTTFEISAGGFEQATYALTDGTVDLGGTEIERSYVYTWMTPWLEESIPSSPSNDVYVREGQEVTISTLPTAKPSGDNNITGFRLYRTITGTSGTSYFRLRTVWFPRTAVEASRTSNVVTLKVDGHHNLVVDDLVKVSGIAFGGIADTSFDVTDVTVDSIVDDETFTYTATGSDKATTATTAGTLYWDIAELDSGVSRFYEGSTFTDDYSVSALTTVLDSEDADAPDDEMQGLISAHNNILAGFIGNEVAFSDPAKPWSWPIKYRIVIPHDIVALASVAGNILVMTDKYPYIISGSTPSVMTAARIDNELPCVAKRGVVSMGYGIVYPTHGGLALFATSGAGIVTRMVHDWDTWDVTLDPATLVGAFYEGKYFGSHTTGSILFEREDQSGGFLVSTPTRFYAAYNDSTTNRFYYVSDLNGTLSEWDASGQPNMTISWKSRVNILTDYVNIGAARVVADYGETAEDIEAINAFNLTVPTTNTAVWALVDQLGTVNGPVDYTDPDTSTYTPVIGAVNSYPVNGDPLTTNLLSTDNIGFVSFSIWANKQLKQTSTITDSEIFRLPSGYKSDTYEVSVSGSLRIRAIHYGETPYGLRIV
ncbi:hypothetical protein [uncultured Paraglaciecola sp.]|uniref:hypothetical protein n=1 Tax=uncultured Paraglaciecola sp. TaxID=1765024 RepID=UPI00260F1274|nr:hypothetical protein [uncultured Paraglaciecola sp.]